MQKEIIDCYQEYKFSGNMGVDLFKRTERKHQKISEFEKEREKMIRMERHVEGSNCLLLRV